jgi:hypothetical protein
MSDTRLNPFHKHPDETVQICVDFGTWLRAGETLSAAALVSTLPAGLTVSGVLVNTALFTDKDGAKTVAIGEGIKLTLAGGASGIAYDVVLRATNSNGVDLPAVTQPVEVDIGAVGVIYRATDRSVRDVISLKDELDVESFIRTASNVLASLETCMAGKNNAATLTDIETYLAAHFAAMRDPQYQTRSQGRTSSSFQGQTAMGFQLTWWGQTATRLDVTGCLGQLDRMKHKVSAAWLGKPPSEQTPYSDRD